MGIIERGILGLDLISAQAWRGTQTNSQSSSGGVFVPGGGLGAGSSLWSWGPLKRKKGSPYSVYLAPGCVGKT